MDKFLGNVLIIDGSYAIYRACANRELAQLQTRGGKPSGGIFGFLRILGSVLHKYPGYYPLVCFDHGRSQRRLELYPNYKHEADRKSNPIVPGSDDDIFLSSLREQRASVMEYLNAIRVPALRIPGWEGDDLVYLLSKASKKCVVITDDKDMIQLCSPTCKIDRTMNGQVIEYETCDAYYKYPRYEYRKAIVGDSSDNIHKCCEGIGGTSADKIAEVMAEFVEMSGCDPHDYQIIFNYLASEELIPRWSEVRGLKKKIGSFIECIDKFTLNMKLTDFHYVEEPANLQTVIESQVIPVLQKKPSIMEAFRILGKYEINTIDPGQMMAHLVGASYVLINSQ